MPPCHHATMPPCHHTSIAAPLCTTIPLHKRRSCALCITSTLLVPPCYHRQYLRRQRALHVHFTCTSRALHVHFYHSHAACPVRRARCVNLDDTGAVRQDGTYPLPDADVALAELVQACSNLVKLNLSRCGDVFLSRDALKAIALKCTSGRPVHYLMLSDAI